MGIEDVKRWQWVVIAVIVGAIFAFARSQVRPDEMMAQRRSIAPDSFVADLGRTVREGALPVLRNVVIYPAVEGKHFITGERLERVPGGSRDEAAYTHFTLHATIPFKTDRLPNPPRADYSILDHIAEAAAGNDAVSYTYAWWHEPGKGYALWIGLSVLLIGGIWPTLINLMIGAGLVPKKEPKIDYDLDRFKSEALAPPPSSKTMSSEEMDQLRAVEAQLEANLKGSGVAQTGDGASEHSEAPVKQLSAGPLEQAAVAQLEEDKQYAGEFYPVVRPGGKKHE